MSTPLVEPSPANSPVLSRKGFAQEPSFKFGPEDFLKLSVEINKSERYEQIQDVKNIIIKDNLIHPTRIDPEVDWFYMKLGIERDYFDSTPAPVIAKHILALYSAKMVSHATNNRLEVQLHNHAEGGAIFIVPSVPGVRDSPAMAVEQMIEEHFLGDPNSPPTDLTKATKTLTISQTTLPPTIPPHGFRLACYRTAGSVSPSSDTRLRMYFLSTPIYPGEPVPTTETTLQQVSDIQFWARSSDNTKKIYQEVMTEVLKSIRPVIRAFPSESEKGSRLVIGFKRGSTHSYWSALSDLYHYFGMYTTHKYVEQLSNDVVICSMYLAFMEKGTFMENGAPNVALAMKTLSEQASLCYVLPRTSLSPLYTNGPLSAEEVTYAYVLWKFSYQFLNRFAVEYDAIAQALRKDVKAKNMLATMKSRLMKDTFTESRVREAIMLYPGLIKDLYKDFIHYHRKTPGKPTPAYDRTHGNDIYNNIIKQTTTELDAQVYTACLNFNRHVLKTNYFKATKVALSFRLDPAFIDTRGYAEVPFGVFFVVGSEFRGFHIRFRDIARGGIRIIKSANKTTYDQNSASLFEENYNLAYTQQQKNKDIPEGGSKGTILLTTDHQNKAEVAFRKYIDALLDVLLPTEEIVDYYNKEEILFLGPDEGTADYMDWASQHARSRKYPFWKAFTTGKSPAIGGIPHDLHGMTTRSIHQYVLGTLAKLGLDEKNCSKFQTGGPDGDLGSNEIKISEDKTVGIVDGSGVLYDPNGLDRTELVRLATARVMSKEYSKDKLSPQGFFVSITDVDVTLPNGTPVSSGMAFRNNFHLNPLVSTDIFVPCGGRPESVQMNNVDQLLNKDGTPRFKIVVEGANLFFTQNARLILEEKGVIIFKDASANKGGVTSSSLEVFSALALNDEEFAEKMMVKGEIPAFHKAYIADVHHKIETNARQEFECIWREHEKSGTPRCVLSDELSKKINNLNDQIQTSPLWDDLKLRNRILSEACPKTLLDSIGLEKIVQRVPETYMRAIFGASLASRFVYECGIHSPEFAFFTFVQKYTKD